MRLGLLARVAAVLDSLGAQYALVGAAALAAHGVARSTFDLDLLTTNPATLDPAAWTSLSSDAAVSVSLRRGDADDPLAGVVRVEALGERTVDVVVGRGEWQEAAVRNAVPISLGGVSLPVVRAADLLLLKLYAGGTQDLWDVEQLLAADPAIADAVEPRLGALPAAVRRSWQRVLARGR